MNSFIIHIHIFWLVILFIPLNVSALEKLSESQLKTVNAQTGLSMQMNNVTLNWATGMTSFQVNNNQNKFGEEIGNGSLAFQNTNLWLNTSGHIELDTGTIPNMNEDYVVVDLYQLDVMGHAFEDMNVPNDPDLFPDADPWQGRYWRTIDEQATSPVIGNKAGIIAQFNAFDDSEFELKTALQFTQEYEDQDTIQQSLGQLEISGIHMSEFPNNPFKPESIMTVYPHSGISMELRTRLTIDTIEYKADSARSSSRITGIHFRESFPNDLPDCYPELKDNGWDVHLRNADDGTLLEAPSTIDTSTWQSYYPSDSEIENNKPKHMYTGYFLIGNLNQVDFNDSVSNGQDKRNLLALDLFSDDLQFKLAGEAKDVQVVSAPMTFDLGSDNKGPFINLNIPMHGSIRIEETAGLDGANMGPVALDGLRVKMLNIRFPGNGIGHCKQFSQGRN